MNLHADAELDLMPPAFAEGLDDWSCGDGTPDSPTWEEAENARLARGDATGFDASALLGRGEFDRVVLSFALSMIPDWQAALTQAVRLLAPGGRLLMVDFGDCAGLPSPFRALLRAWLAQFHVTPRLDLSGQADRLARAAGFRAECRRGPFGYYQLITLTRPSD